MTLETISDFAFALMVIYVVLGMYIWHFKIIPFLRKKEFAVNFWSLMKARDQKIQAFLESFSKDADKPWFYYYVKYRFVVGIVLLIHIVFLSLR